MRHLLFLLGLSGLALGVAAPAFGDNLATVEGDAASTVVTVDSNPVVTAILSQPITVGTKTYTSWAFLVSDSTGSAEIYASSASLGSYVPTVGDTLSLSGTYSPFHQIPEIATITAISKTGTASVPAIAKSSVSQLNQTTLPESIAGHLFELDNVTISGETPTPFDLSNSPTGATITDASGSMTLYYWPTSYSSTYANFNGLAVPTTPVNLIGFVSVFNTGPAEFTPISFATAVPEPASLGLVAAGGLALLRRRRR